MKSILVGLLCLTWAVETSRGQDNPVLPDLAPREVEITGELTISFPSLRRQPLIGFNPPPRIPDVPESRRPFAEEYLQRRADLPLSPLRAPAAPAVSAYANGPRFDGSIEAGAGVYVQRYVALDVASDASSQLEWRVTGGYSGRSGFSPVTAVGGSSASYDLGRLRAGMQSGSPALRFGVETEGSLQSYVLFAARPAAEVMSNPAPERTGKSGSLDTWVAREAGSWRFRLDAGLSASGFETGVFDTAIRSDGRTRRTDAGTGVRFEAETGSDVGGLVADAAWNGSSFDGGPIGRPDVSSWSTAAGARLSLDSGIRIRGGVRLLGFVANREATGLGRREFTWLTPDIRVDAAPHPAIRLMIENAPILGSARLDELYREQPYAVDSPAMEPQLWPVNAAARGTAAVDRVEISLGARWRSSPNRRYFEPSVVNFGTYERGLSTASYGPARELSAEVDANIYLGPGTKLLVGGRLRDGSLTDLDVAIPYFASWTAFTMVSAAFGDGRGLVQLTGRMEGSRPIDTTGSVRLDPFADLDFVASYRVTKSASAVVRMENLAGGRPEWDGYLRPSPIVTGGLLWQF